MSSQQVSESTFVSTVTIPSYMRPWPRLLNGDGPLALLHAKFWGTSMAAEEQQWLNAQQASPATGSGLGLRDQEGEEHMDAVGNEKMQTAGVDETVVDETMDEATTMDPDDDIISGCYMLDIDIKGLRLSKLWIRAEYIRVFNFVNVYHDRPTVAGKAPCVVVTGQPGIGELVASSDCFENDTVAYRQECMGLLRFAPMPCRKETGHLVLQNALLPVCGGGCLRDA